MQEQMQAVTMMQTKGTPITGNRATMKEQQTGDPFMMIFQAMMEGTLSADGQPMGTPEESQQGGEMAASEAQAAILMQNMGLLFPQFASENTSVGASALSNVASTIQTLQAMAQNADSGTSLSSAQMLQALTTITQEAQAGQQVTAQTQLEALLQGMSGKGAMPLAEKKDIATLLQNLMQVVGAKGNATVETASPAAQGIVVMTQDASAGDGLSSERNFLNAVQTAKKQMQGQDQAPVTNHATVITRPLTDGAEVASTKADFALENPKLAKQIETGIKEHYAKGLTEYIIKLNPADLGEITVKMVKEAGKLSVYIASGNASTSQLIQNELAALKEALRPMQADVFQVQPTSTETQQSFNQLPQFNQQQFNQQQQASQQTGNGSYGQNEPIEEEALVEEAVQLEDGNISMYI